LFKGGLAIEALRKVKAVIMDKTGTLTKGTFAVNEIVCTDSVSEDVMLQLAASCESTSTHPVATSILEAASVRGLDLKHASSSSEFAGMGMKATFPEGIVLCGNMAQMNKYAGHFIISDVVKDDAASAVSQLVSAGLTPAMLTGDAAGSAGKIASEVGIDRVHAELLPQDKLDTLNSLRDELGPVMFVGDGINDAPVLAGADVGAAMGSGTDAAIEAADVVFMNSSVSAIPQSIDIANATGRIATQNIVFALLIKFLVIVMGFAGFANIWAAVFADTGVAMLCILNSLRLLWKKF
jgi:Cd2+/Zn2+-exporting ATPase